MKLLSLLVLTAVIIAAVAATARLAWRSLRPAARHEPIEYYRSWSRYWHPATLIGQISKAEADALAAEGAAYLAGHFDARGRLVRVVKYLNGEVFFEYRYSYYPGGRLQSATVIRAGRETTLHYDEHGRLLTKAGAVF